MELGHKSDDMTRSAQVFYISKYGRSSWKEVRRYLWCGVWRDVYSDVLFNRFGTLSIRRHQDRKLEPGLSVLDVCSRARIIPAHPVSGSAALDANRRLARPHKKMSSTPDSRGRVAFSEEYVARLLACNPLETLEQLVSRVDGLLQRIHESPGEPQYRRVRLMHPTIKTEVLASTGGLETLLLVGFRRSSEVGSAKVFVTHGAEA
eukprot:scaffold7381_cov310-Pinguiococcus_pyrenoidosus.AAC.132